MTTSHDNHHNDDNNDKPLPLDLLLLPSWIAPVEPVDALLVDHALGIRDGRIVLLAPRAELTAYSARETLELPGMLLTPGLVNAHGHAAMSLMRGLADDLPLQQWLEHYIWPTEQRWVDAAFVRDGTALAIAEQVKGGVTCCADMYFYLDAAAAVIAASGTRAQLTVPIMDFPVPGAPDTEIALVDGRRTFERWHDHPLISIGFGPHSPYSVGDAGLLRVSELAEQWDVGIQMHVQETVQEIETSLANYGERPLARLARLGLLSPRFQAVHLTQVNAADIELLRDSGSSVVHCPESNLKLASGFCPAQRLLDAGINLALGTDGAASNNDLDLLGEARTAALLAKAVAGSATALNAHQALRIATLGGARALGMDQSIGSLELGKAADLVAFDLSGLNQQPLYDPVSQLIYTAGRDCVRHVWVNGVQLLRERRLLLQDEEEIQAKARHWQARLSARE